jgi:hypothetical protein
VKKMSLLERLTDTRCCLDRFPVYAASAHIEKAPVSESWTFLTHQTDSTVTSRHIELYDMSQIDDLISIINTRLVNIINGIERDYYTRTIIDNRFSELEQSMPIITDTWSIFNKKFNTIAHTSSALYTANYPSLTHATNSTVLGGYGALGGVQRLERSSLINANDLKSLRYMDCVYINASDGNANTTGVRSNEVAIGGTGHGDNTLTLGNGASRYYLPGLPDDKSGSPVGMLVIDRDGKVFIVNIPSGGGGGGGGGGSGIGSIIGAIGGAVGGGLAGIIVSKPSAGGSITNPPTDTPSIEFTSDSSVPWEKHALPADQVQVSVPELADQVSLGRNATRYPVHDGYNLMEDVLEESVSRTNYRSALLDGLDDVSDAVPAARMMLSTTTPSTRGTVPHLVTQNKGIINQMTHQQTSNFIKQHLMSDFEGTKKVIASQGLSINQHPDSLTARLHIESGEASRLVIAEGKNHTLGIAARTESTTTTDHATQQPVTTVTTIEELRLPSVPLTSTAGALLTVDEAGVLHTTMDYETRAQTDMKLAPKFDRASFPGYAGGLTSVTGSSVYSFIVTTPSVTHRMTMANLTSYLNTNIRPSTYYNKTETDARVSTALTPYDTSAQVTSKISTALTPYATTSSVDGKISTALTPYATTNAVDSKISAALTPYATISAVDAKIAEIPSVDLSGYDTRAQVDAKLSPKFDANSIGNYVAGLTNSSVGTSNFFMFQSAGGQSSRVNFATLLSFIASNTTTNSFYTKNFIDSTFYKIAELDGILTSYLTFDKLGLNVRGLATSTPTTGMSFYTVTASGHARITMPDLVSFLTTALPFSSYSTKAELLAKLTDYYTKAECDAKEAALRTSISERVTYESFDRQMRLKNVNPSANAWADNVILCPGSEMKHLSEPGSSVVRIVRRNASRLVGNSNADSHTNTLVGQNILNNISDYSVDPTDYIAHNTYVGQAIFPESSSGIHMRNVAVGAAIGGLSVGAAVQDNILLGVDQLKNHRGQIRDNIIIGNRSGAPSPQVGFDKAMNNCILIGHDVSYNYFQTVTTANEIHLGNSSHIYLRCHAARGRVAGGNGMMSTVDGTVCIAPSSRRYKSNIAPITEDEVTRFEAMEPVSYNYTESGQFQFGFIAEDAMPEVLLYDVEGRPDGIQHHTLHALQKGMSDRLKKRVEVLEAELVEERAARVALEERLARLEALLLEQ